MNHQSKLRASRKPLCLTLLGVLAWLCIALPAHAADQDGDDTPTPSDGSSSWVADPADQGGDKGVAFYAHSLKWYEQHTFYRFGAGRIVYFGSSTPVNLDNPSATAQLAVPPGPIQGGSAGLSQFNNTIAGELGFIIPYFGEHFSLEVAIAPPLKFDFEAHGTLANQSIAPNALDNQPGQPAGDPLPTGVGPIGTKIGTLHALPPNLTLVYRPWLDTIIRPYIGVGAVWLFTYNTKVTAYTLTHNLNLAPQLVLSRPIGCVAQAGFDLRLLWHVYLTADARYLGCASVHAELRNVSVYSPRLSPTQGPVSIGTISTSAKFQAVLFQLSIGSTFWGD